jgi:hypothetical protein
MASICASSGWSWVDVGLMTIPEAMAMGRAWQKVAPLPLLLNGIVTALSGPVAEATPTVEIPATQQAAFDEWVAKQLDALQEQGGAVSNVMMGG